uniref:Acid sensing ion channel subunit 1 n=1 Tax=Terrapene triunguis TaxID=2587831 RepID=A0A674INV0_9SAUR
GHGLQSPAGGSPQPCAPGLEEFASRSTLHGIHHIFAHGPYMGRHLLWTLAFLGSLGLLLHVYAERVAYYVQYPHNTQLEEETTPHAAFPAVTLCNLNRARFSQLTGHDLYWAGELLGLLDSAHQPLAPEALETLAGKLALSPEEQRRPFDLLELYRHVQRQPLPNRECSAPIPGRAGGAPGEGLAGLGGTDDT